MNKKIIAGITVIIAAFALSVIALTSSSTDVSEDEIVLRKQTVPIFVEASSVFPKYSFFSKEYSELHQWNYNERIRIDNSDMTDGEKRLAHQQRRLERSRRGWEVWNQGDAEPALKVSRALSTLRFIDAEYTGTLEAPFKEELELLKLVANYNEDASMYHDIIPMASARCSRYLDAAKSKEMKEFSQDCLLWANKLK